MTEEAKFYDDAKKYWEHVSPTVDGMLGGYSHISSTDIGGSSKFLRPFIRGTNAKTGTRRALDCGSGIGRITKRLLLPLFQTVDMVELNEEFLQQARPFLGEHASRVERYICSSLHSFTPEQGRYDVIWCQWVLGHLTDVDLTKFFKRCQSALAENGIIVVKENTASSNTREFDENDSSFTRPKQLLVDIIQVAGLTIVREEKQTGFPKNIYDVWMFALR